MTSPDLILAALIELVAVKEMREEVSRRRQRRAHSVFSNPQEVAEVAALHQECKVREHRAWNMARAVIAKSKGRAS